MGLQRVHALCTETFLSALTFVRPIFIIAFADI